MKKIKKIFILILFTTFTLSTVVGVYAWFTFQPATEGLDLYTRSRELFGASARIELANELIDYNSNNYDSNELVLRYSKAQIQSHVEDATFPLEIEILVRAYKNIKVRFKVVELWTIESGSSTVTAYSKPNVFTWNYDTEGDVDSHGYYYHPNTIFKTNSDFSVNFLTSATVNVAVLNSLPANSHVKISVVVSAVQANRSSVWDPQNPNHVTSTLQINNTTQSLPVKVKFVGVANPQLKRGVFVEFKSANNNYGYLYHERLTTLVPRVILQPGTYLVYINLVNHLKFDVSIISNVLTITVSYKEKINASSWGYEDILYAPDIIPNWQSDITYGVDDVVFYDDAIDGGENAGYYRAVGSSTNAHPDSNPWAWRIISIQYFEARTYTKGDIIYAADGNFYRAKQTIPANTPPPSAWAWELLGNKFASAKPHIRGDYSYTEANGIKTYYIAHASTTPWGDAPAPDQPFRKVTYNFDTFNYGEYILGEYLGYQGNHYKIIGNVWNGSNPVSNPTVFKRISNVYINNRSYVQGTVIMHNSNYYIALSTISNGQTPGSHANWRLLSHQGDYNLQTSYQRYQSVIYNTKRYFWNGTGQSLGANPETDTNWWLLGDAWHSKNTYVEDSVVSHNNELYVLRSGSSTNAEPGVLGQWQPLSLNWSKTGIYYNTTTLISVVLYKDEYYKWTGLNGTTMTLEPDEYGSGWNKLTESWIDNNTYKQGDFVRYDGSFWELLLPTNPTDQRNVPGIDFTVWKEHPILWDPNRN